jgi:hypothetical protein
MMESASLGFAHGFDGFYGFILRGIKIAPVYKSRLSEGG